MNAKMFYVCVIILIVPASSVAETWYVTDMLKVAVRTGMGVEYNTLAIVESNEKVELIATEGEYAKLRLNNGEEGWILRRYLTQSIPKPAIISNIESRLEALTTKNKASSEKIRNLIKEKSVLKNTKAMQEKEITTLTNKYENLKTASSDYISLNNSHEKLKKEMEKNRRKTADLSLKNENLREKNNLLWFVAGSSAVLAGFIIGLLLQNFRFKRKKSLSF